MRIGDVHVFENQRRQQEFSPVLPLFVRPADLHSMDARALLGPSYQYNFNEDVAIMAHTGASLGARFALVDEGGTDFVFGWDIGARIKYKRVAFIYTATIGITNMATAHSVGLAFGF